MSQSSRVVSGGRLAALVVILCAMMPKAHAAAQTSGAEPWEITDNSFLVEEAFNQERGIFQNIFTWTQGSDNWSSTFTQEWPVPAMRHQLSYTLPFAGGEDISSHVGAVLLNYRYQALEEGPGRPAFSPRFSVILPTGDPDDNSDRPGVQVNLPFSKQLNNVYLHWNAGFTWIDGVPDGIDKTALFAPSVAGSAILRVKPMLNAMLEGVVLWDDQIRDVGVHARKPLVTISPGLRGGWNLGEKQLILGVAVPITHGEDDTSTAVLTYFSYELPFRKTP